MKSSRGVTLIDTVVGVALMLIVFLGIFAAFQLSVDVVLNNKARAGAVALADERMEYVRSLPYSSIGTVGGIPSGTLAQSESVTLNGVAYTRRTLVEYVDDPKDGTGAADTTGTADYKAVKVDVSWPSHTGARDVAVVSRFEPSSGLESTVTGGTLTINVVDASGQPVSNAQVTVVNASSSPTVNLTTYSNVNGSITLPGTPAASNYAITVTKSGYSTAQTYASSAQNPSPSPANLTVSNNQTTSSTFAIDQLSSLTILTLLYDSTTTIGSVPVTVTSAKTIGTGIHKYSASVGGTGSATTTLSSMEWDTYTMSVPSTTGYDLASSCSPQPVSLSPGASVSTTLYLAPHTSNSLPVKVVSGTDGSLISGASVQLSKTGFSATQTTDSCGQTFFSSLTTGAYTLSVSAPGHATFNASNVQSTSTVYAVTLN